MNEEKFSSGKPQNEVTENKYTGDSDKTQKETRHMSDNASAGGTGVPTTRIRMSEQEMRQQKEKEILELSTAQIGLLVRTTNCLESEGILTVRDLLNCTPERLLRISNFGEKTLLEVYAALEKLGFKRKSKR
ncbi:MAG: DNA-directed RNA polymerase subunit alpha C-terminal domain-containing protein [Planctomycetia bacterium]|nr:DNA-directed RNA polymerase subunit alpha C-terminal domain-containing protein [Planctomycetia bacterium]